MKAFMSVVVLAGALALFSFEPREVLGAAGLTQAQAGGGVTVKATYLNPQGTDESRFSVGLDTHAVNLDAYDLKTIVVLRDDTGKIYQPTRVENAGSGHHREATIAFPKPGGKKLELVVKDVAGVKERTFRWELE